MFKVLLIYLGVYSMFKVSFSISRDVFNVVYERMCTRQVICSGQFSTSSRSRHMSIQR